MRIEPFDSPDSPRDVGLVSWYDPKEKTYVIRTNPGYKVTIEGVEEFDNDEYTRHIRYINMFFLWASMNREAVTLDNWPKFEAWMSTRQNPRRGNR